MDKPGSASDPIVRLRIGGVRRQVTSQFKIGAGTHTRQQVGRVSDLTVMMMRPERTGS
ncbi:MAG: hypothetical protein ABSB61_05360 [Anaerolineales bacterium]